MLDRTIDARRANERIPSFIKNLLDSELVVVDDILKRNAIPTCHVDTNTMYDIFDKSSEIEINIYIPSNKKITKDNIDIAIESNKINTKIDVADNKSMEDRKLVGTNKPSEIYFVFSTNENCCYNLDYSNIKASFDNNVLHLSIMKTNTDNKKIEISGL